MPPPEKRLSTPAETDEHKRTKAVEKALHKSEARLRLITDNMVDTISQIDAQQNIVYVSPSVERVFGYKIQALLGRSVFELVHPDDAERVYNIARSATEVQTTTIRLEYRYRDIKGKYLWVESTVRFFYDDQGGFAGAIFGSRDINKRKRAEMVQSAIYRISEAVHTARSMEELYRSIHAIIGELMPANNFFIALYNASVDLFTIAYFVDQYDTASATLKPGKSLTGYVLRTGKPLLATPAVFEQLVQTGGVESIGAPSIDWLGVPLNTKQGTIGVMVVQTYSEADHLREDDKDVLVFVSKQVAMVIERKQAEEALRESEQKFRSIIEQSSEGIILVDEQGFIIGWNQANEKITGIKREEALGKPFWDVQHQETPPERRSTSRYEDYKTVVLNALQTGQSSIFNLPIEATICRPNGELVVVQQTVFPINTEQGIRLGSVSVDVTERKQTEEKIQRELRKLDSLRAIDTSMTTGQDLNRTIKLILDQVMAHLQIDATDILLLKRDEQSLGFISGQGFRTGAIYETHLSYGDGLAWQVVLNRQKISYHIGEDIPGISFSGLLEKESFASYIGLPLIVKEKVKGVLEVFNRSQLNLDDEWIDFLETLAGQAAIAISNTELFTDLQRSNEELAQAYEAIIEGWSQALELRDKETKGHSERVTHLACDMAIEVGYMAEEIVLFRQGVLLHDIGKMGIPDSILLKPGPLEPEEWAIMRQHPIYAWQLLKDIPHLQQALDIPYYHHEKWDGSGYPLGLEGEEIPLSARIFAIVDVWDALCSDRPYRPAWPEEEVLEYIRQQSGKHFDPKLVELFLRIMGNR